MSEYVVWYGRRDEPHTTYRKSEQWLAVRTHTGRSLENDSEAQAEVDGHAVVMGFPEVGVQVFQVTNEFSAHRDRLQQSPEVRFAGAALVEASSGQPAVYTENVFTKFADEVPEQTCLETLKQAGLSVKTQPEFATNAYFCAAPEGIGVDIFAVCSRLLELGQIEFCHPEIVRYRALRGISPGQWHLKSTWINGVAVEASANVEEAHKVTKGEGVTIAIIDDGVALHHPEFQAPGKIVAPRDVTNGNDDVTPCNNDHHGTCCAGVACAIGWGLVTGVAPAARLMPIRLNSALGSLQEAEAFYWATKNGADVISCSWGPPDGAWFKPDDPQHTVFSPLPASTRLAIEYAVTQGRGGKGCLVLFSAGNGGESADLDGYVSCEYVLAVAACNDHSQRSIYSDFGKAIFCCFPSSDRKWPGRPDPLTPGIFTTSHMGLQICYQDDFGGTSSACPGAAGVAALVLSVNPTLRWQDVREILARTADKIDEPNGNYVNGHSVYYGFGRVNAARAVERSYLFQQIQVEGERQPTVVQ